MQARVNSSSALLEFGRELEQSLHDCRGYLELVRIAEQKQLIAPVLDYSTFE
jgi:hypothetical protein